jgi:ribosome-associated protein
MTAAPASIALAQTAARAASEKLATDFVALDVSEQMPLTDIFVMCSARNERMVAAIADAVDDALREEGAPRLRQEGRSEGRWILLDFGDIVVHVFHGEERIYYQLERLWRDCPVVPLEGIGHVSSES